MESQTMSATVSLPDVVNFLNQELNVSCYSDIAHNGLQVESPRRDLITVGFAVDAGMSVLTEACRRNCQLLVVHHGIMWGKLEPFVGPLARKLALCLEQGLSLYAAHLPLDGHTTLGNAAQLARFLGATDIQPFFHYKGSSIGALATLPTPRSLAEITSQLSQCEGALNPPLTLPFGRTIVQRIGIATGSASSLIPETVERGLDLLITGEPKQEAYHSARDLNCSVVCMGHYASETFGVRALERVLEEKFGVKTEWISEPTGI
jgi:dinuclear metal center YbgI/SA1388 family protein